MTMDAAITIKTVRPGPTRDNEGKEVPRPPYDEATVVVPAAGAQRVLVADALTKAEHTTLTALLGKIAARAADALDRAEDAAHAKRKAALGHVRGEAAKAKR